MSDKEGPPAADAESVSSQDMEASEASGEAREQTHAGDKAESERGHRPKSARTFGAWLAPIALLLALVAFGLALWVLLDQEDDQGDAFAAAGEVEALTTEVADLSARLERLDERLDSLADGVEELEIDAAGRREAFRQAETDTASLNERLTTLEDRLADAVERLQAESDDQREVDQNIARQLELTEAAGLLRLGQQRAQLARDWTGARTAYQRASSRLRDFASPRYDRVRGLVARELEALEAIDEPDWVALSGRLARMAESSADWPGGAEVAEAPGDAGAGGAAQAAESGWWAGVRRSLARLVRVTPRDSVPITAEQVDAAREEVRVRLLAAEMAVARRDVEELAHHVEAAGNAIRQWFDVDAAAPARALEELDRIAETELPEVPVLGEALAEITRLMEAAP